MIDNMKDFFNHVNLLIQKLNTMNDFDSAKSLQDALLISNSFLEILGQTKKEIHKLEKNKLLIKLDSCKEINEIKKFISKYW